MSEPSDSHGVVGSIPLSNEPDTRVLFSADDPPLEDHFQPSPRSSGTHSRQPSWSEEAGAQTRHGIRTLLANSSTSGGRMPRFGLGIRLFGHRRFLLVAAVLGSLILTTYVAHRHAPEYIPDMVNQLDKHPWTSSLKDSYGSVKGAIWGSNTPTEMDWDEIDDLVAPTGYQEGGYGSIPESTHPPSPTSTHQPLTLSSDDHRLLLAVKQLLKTLPIEWPWEADLTARKETLEELEALKVCLEDDACRDSQKKVVVGGSFHFGNSQYGHVSGEDIWARSSIDAFRSLGYTILYAYKPLEILHIHRVLGEWIPVILMEASAIKECLYNGVPRRLEGEDLKHVPFYHIVEDRAEVRRLSDFHGLGLTIGDGDEVDEEDEEEGEYDEGDEEGQEGEEEEEADVSQQRREERRKQTDRELYGWLYLQGGMEEENRVGCIKRKGFEEGIPLWKTLAYHFWPSVDHALGAPWTLSPEDYAGMSHGSNTFLGYSIEKYCKQHHYVKPADRKDQAFVFGKEIDYFHEGNSAWFNGNHTFKDLSHSLKMTMIAAVGDAERTILPDEGLENIGRQTIEGFYEAIGESKVLIGMGKPILSPTPYDALCLGVPFINPISWFEYREPFNRDKWNTQQDGLKELDPPYVYHVPAGNVTALEHAVRSARENPIEVYIPPKMTAEATKERHRVLVEKDWLKKAESVIKDLQVKNVYLKSILL